jgi:hypothetical protein
MAMATWTIDNAAGINEYAVFITSEGEVAVYQGYDPSSAGSWSLVGVFRIGRPVGRRCFEKMGSDLIVITSDGFMPMSKALLTDRSQLSDAISGKIINLANADVANYGANFGWDIKLYPLGSKLIINVPAQVGVEQYQYVMNTTTTAWCVFTGWNANCFAVKGDVLYFGGNLTSGVPNSAYVAVADSGNSDNGDYIVGEVQTAFQYFDEPGMLKRWTMARPVFYTAGTMVPAIRLDVDFESVIPTSTGSFTNTGGTAWNTAAWNTFPWGSVLSIKKAWQHISGIGYAGALHMRISNNATPVSWMSVDYVYRDRRHFVNLVYGHDAAVARWVQERAPHAQNGFRDFVAIGIERNGDLVAGVVYNEYRGHSIHASIASSDPRWASRRTLAGDLCVSVRAVEVPAHHRLHRQNHDLGAPIP